MKFREMRNDSYGQHIKLVHDLLNFIRLHSNWSFHQLVFRGRTLLLSLGNFHGLSSRTSDDKFAVAIHLHLLVFTGVKNFQNVLSYLVLTAFCTSSLQKYLDVAQFSKVEVSFLVKSIVLQLQL